MTENLIGAHFISNYTHFISRSFETTVNNLEYLTITRK